MSSYADSWYSSSQRCLWRYKREKRIVMLTSGNVSDEKADLRKAKKKANLEMNEKISKTFSDLIHYSEKENADELLLLLEKNIFKRYPTPMNRILMAMQFLRQRGIEVDNPVWIIKIGTLKTQVAEATNPNNFYVRGY